MPQATKNLKGLDYDFATIYPNKKCLSSSQFLDYEKDPADFYVRWVLGAKRSSAAMEVGRIFSALYADRTLDHRALLFAAGAKPWIADLFDDVIRRFPVLKGGHPEFPLQANFEGWQFRATLDDFVADQDVIVENKTGAVPWTQARADNSSQITFQCWVHFRLTGRLPGVIVNWVNTAKARAQIATFRTRRTVQDIHQFDDRARAVLQHLEAGNFSQPIYDPYPFEQDFKAMFKARR